MGFRKGEEIKHVPFPGKVKCKGKSKQDTYFKSVSRLTHFNNLSCSSQETSKPMSSHATVDVLNCFSQCQEIKHLGLNVSKRVDRRDCCLVRRQNLVD